MHERDIFDKIFRRYYRQLYVFAYRIVGNEEESCDLVHDSFEELWSSFHETDENAVKAFLYTCLRRKCIDCLRHRQAQQRYVRLTTAVTSQWGGYLDVSISELEAREKQIGDCIELLRPPTKEIFTLCYVERKKYAEAAEILGISVSTVKKHIVRALKFFRERREYVEQ